MNDTERWAQYMGNFFPATEDDIACLIDALRWAELDPSVAAPIATACAALGINLHVFTKTLAGAIETAHKASEPPWSEYMPGAE